MLDGTFTYLGCYQIALWWASWYFHTPDYYSPSLLVRSILVFTLIILIVNLISGGYRAPYNLLRASKGILYGSIIALVIYALLPVQYRFSRILLLLGTGWALIVYLLVKVLLSLTGLKEYCLDLKKRRRIAIVGFQDESERIKNILEMSGIVTQYILHVYPDKESPSEYFSGNLFQLSEIIDIYHINEVVFSAKDVSSETIIERMKMLKDSNVDFKIASPGSSSVIGSNSANTSGDLYVIKVNSLRRK